MAAGMGEGMLGGARGLLMRRQRCCRPPAAFCRLGRACPLGNRMCCGGAPVQVRRCGVALPCFHMCRRAVAMSTL